MSELRRLLAGCICVLGACSVPSAQQRAGDVELSALAPLKQTYSGVVMGFDLPQPTMLVVSLDLQSYIGMNDADADAMRRVVVARWRTAWIRSHPAAHSVIRVRFIDFIGRTIAKASAKT
jgi:hypothetical protein